MSINDAIEILEKAIEAQKDNRDMLQALTKAVKIADMQGHKNETAAKKSGNQVCAERILLPCM